EGRVHEGEVRERLRKVSELTLRLRVVLLRQQPDVVRETDEALEQRVCVLVPPDELEAVDEPERARKEDALARRQAVDAGLARAVPQDEAVHDEALLDRLDRSADA